MAVYKVKSDQSLFDIAVQLYGSVEGVFDLLISNKELGISDELTEGMELQYHESFIIDQSIVNELKDKGLMVANGERGFYNNADRDRLMFTVNVCPYYKFSSFDVSGTGSMVIDWGDGTPPETVSLPLTKQTVEHYFLSNEGGVIIKVYGSFRLVTLDTSNIHGKMYVVKPFVVKRFRCVGSETDLSEASLFEDINSINLSESVVGGLQDIFDKNLNELVLTDAELPDNALSDYLEYRNDQENNNTTIHISNTVSVADVEAVNRYIDMGTSSKFVFNGTKLN